MREKREPDPYYDALAAKTFDSFPFPLEKMRVLDLGSGTGHNSRALSARGATVIPLDFDPALAAESRGRLADGSGVAGDAMRLPFADNSFDGVFSSNMLEHAPDMYAVLDEIERVLRPNGWAWVAWTNWWSPWGGHSITPLHLLGTRAGPRAWRALFGEPEKNAPGVALFPTYIGSTLARMREREGFELVDAMPRYYPQARWLLRVPVLREVATWNCLMLLQKPAAA
jgi:SAM-dependent methyltransferase